TRCARGHADGRHRSLLHGRWPATVAGGGLPHVLHTPEWLAVHVPRNRDSHSKVPVRRTVAHELEPETAKVGPVGAGLCVSVKGGALPVSPPPEIEKETELTV